MSNRDFHVRCNCCANAEGLGHGDQRMGWLLCRAGGGGGFGNQLRRCPRFVPRAEDAVPTSMGGPSSLRDESTVAGIPGAVKERVNGG